MNRDWLWNIDRDRGSENERMNQFDREKRQGSENKWKSVCERERDDVNERDKAIKA